MKHQSKIKQDNIHQVIMKLVTFFKEYVRKGKHERNLKHVDFSPQVSEIQSRSAQMEVQNNHLDSDLKQCEHNRKEAAAEAATQLQNKQKSHDDQVDYAAAVRLSVCVASIRNMHYTVPWETYRVIK